ncbi:MAG: hypothetical protein AAFR59_15155, partial [Bacteroidota bacterium]
MNTLLYILVLVCITTTISAQGHHGAGSSTELPTQLAATLSDDQQGDLTQAMDEYLQSVRKLRQEG